MASRFLSVFKKATGNIIGMVHLSALPGSPGWSVPVKDIILRAVDDASILHAANVDSLLIENMYDVPYVLGNTLPVETFCSATVACYEIRKQFPSIPIGLQLLAGANRQALAIAATTGLQYIRVEGFSFSHIADEGFVDACAGHLLRYRQQLGRSAERIMIFADIKKKHSSHSLTSDLSIADVAQANEFFCADGNIVTGSSTGKSANPSDVEDAMAASNLPVLVGSGVTAENVSLYIGANALIVGSDFKEGGYWANALDGSRVKRFMQLVKHLKNDVY